MINNKIRPLFLWRLWIIDALLVSSGILFFIAQQYGTYEFFGRACAMALLPLIPVLVLVGGAGSTVFALTKVWLEKHKLSLMLTRIFLVGPALLVMILLVRFGANRTPENRLAYICLGNAPATASAVRVAGFSTFLRSEWLAVFHINRSGFEAMVKGGKMESGSAGEFKGILSRSAHQQTRLWQSVPPWKHPLCFQRIFKESEEHQRGGVYAVYDPTTETAVVFREYHD